MSYRTARGAPAALGARTAVVGALVAALSFVAAPPVQAAQVSFTDPTDFAAGGTPLSLAVGDFDGDTDSDMAVANAGSGGVSVLLNDGTGEFGAPTNFGLPNGPQSVVVGDFNGDGDPDLVVANGSGTVSVLLGQVGGSFGAAVNFPAGVIPVSAAVGDFDGDSDLDVAVTDLNFSAPGVSVLLGDGTGSLGTATHIPVGTVNIAFPYAVAVGDFNHDADPDLAIAITDGSVSVLLGQEGGSFGPATSFPAGSPGPIAGRSVAVGDFNGDTHPDVVVASTTSDSVSVLLGGGEGSFGPATSFPAGDGPWAVAVGDFDGDAHTDLAVAAINGGGVSVLLGGGDGTFGPATSFAAGSSPFSVAVGDFNGDADPDLGLANAGAGTVSILLNTPVVLPSLIALSPAHTFVGLKNSDDQGTRFDVRVELLKNGTLVASGLSRCVSGVTRNPAQAKDVVVTWDPFTPVPLNAGDVMSLRVSTRIGTKPNDTACGGHASATGVRLYYDAATRQSRFDVTITGRPDADLFLHSDGAACNNAPSKGVTTRTLDATAPSAASAKCQDSTTLKFAAGNPWRVIGTWSLAPQV